MKYLREFSTQAAYEAAKSNLELPNVSYIEETNGVAYKPKYTSKVVTTFNITTTESETPITRADEYVDATTGFSKIEIDGVEQNSVQSAYTFSTLGEHTVTYTLKDPTKIHHSAFAQIGNMIAAIIPSGVTTFEGSAFEYNTGVTTVTFAEGSLLASIYSSFVFSNCVSLTSVNFLEGVTYLGDNMFSSCSSLTSVVLPSTITHLGFQMFRNCSNLQSATIKSVTPPPLGFNSNPFYGCSNVIIYVPSESVDAYKAANGWSDYASRIQAIP